MWSVRTMPHLVFTVEPSISGSRSRCTPSRETLAPVSSCWLVTLSISSRKTMPVCSVTSTARPRMSSSSISFDCSSSVTALKAVLTGIRRNFLRPLFMLENMVFNWLVMSSSPGGAMISMPAGCSASCNSISRSSSSPSRNFLRNIWRALESRASPSCSLARRQQHVEDAFFGPVHRHVLDLLNLGLPQHLDRLVDQVADDRLDIAADIADFGELGRFDLDERRPGELGETPGDLGLGRRRWGRSSICSSA